MCKIKLKDKIRLFTILIVSFIYWMVAPAYAKEQDYHILIINSYHANFTWTSEQTEAILNELKSLELNTHIHVEHMDWKNFPTKQNLESLYVSYKNKYKDMGIDIVITTDDAALEFALKNRKELFSNAPIVFSGVNEEGVSYLVGNKENVTGVIESFDLEETVFMALQINPNVRKIYIVHDQTESGISTSGLVGEYINSFGRGIMSFHLTNKTHEDILESIKNLEENSAVLITTYYSDTKGVTIEFEDFCKRVSDVSKVPVFHMYDMTMGHGNIGGSMVSGRIQGKKAAELAIRILNGEKADNIDIINDKLMVKAFDYEQLQKFQIPMKRVPQGIKIINEPFSFFKTYRNLVITVIFILTMLIVFIFILILHIKEIRQVKSQLQESHEELTQTYEELIASDEELQQQVAELNKVQAQLRKMAYYDPLTQLPNRRALHEDFQCYVDECKGKKGAMLFIDADNFKLINDTLGHSLGDEFIIQMGKRIENLINNSINIYRMGGDEFILLVKCIEDIVDIKRIADDIIVGFDKGFHIQDMVIHNSISVGIAIYPDHGTTSEELIMRADIAMYRAKEEGKAKYVFYDWKMNEDLLERVSIEKNLRTAIYNEELLLYYQPQYHFKTKEIIGFEALLRWKNKELGWVSPLKFIKVAEDSHTIIPIGKWVLQKACEFIKNVHNLGYKEHTIAVNISLLQIMQEDFVDMVLEILKENELDATYLELEMTETMLIENFRVVGKKLEILRAYGMKIALDDFGTGYSSLSYLNRLPINTLKIDKSFVDTISNQNDQRVIINILINLGHRLGLKVLAEGVETEAEFSYLAEYNCDFMQGYLLSRPLPEQEVLHLLATKA